MRSVFGPLFPWRFFRSLFFTQLVVLNLVFWLATVLASYIINFSFFQSTTVFLFLVYFVLSLVSSTFFAYRFARPLKRLILKSIRMANKKSVEMLKEEEEDWSEDELGEFSDVAAALDQIKKKMKRRKQQLSHEREEYRALISGLEDAVVSFDLGGGLKFYNSRFATFFLTKELMKRIQAEERVLLTETFREPDVIQAFELAASKGQVQQLQLKTQSRLDQAQKFFSVYVVPLREEKTRDIYAVQALFHDITEIKRAELIRLEFVENASHELRTPLTSIKGYLSTLQEDFAGKRFEQADKFLGIVSKNVDRLVDLVNDMLTLSALEANQGLTKEKVNLQALTVDVIERLSGLAAEKNIRIHFENQAGLLDGDPKKIEQVLQNLISNAIKYIPDGKQIDVSWLEGSHEIILKVSDNGPGIPAEHLERLFERFYRIEKSRSRDVGGTGLGLAIVKHIVQNHGGRVEARSELGKGAEFICSFPRGL
jgi:two-component system phosphate regulon sensor histidine kinase PhoR